MLKFLIFVILFIILVRVISNLFLRGPKKKNSKTRFFYQAFKNIREQQKNQQNHAHNEQDEPVKGDLDNIEEAEYEDITEENTKSSSKDN